MKTTLKHTETYASTVYVNYNLTIDGKEYKVCVDYAEGIQDIEISNNGGETYESLYDKQWSMFEDEDRRELIALIEEDIYSRNWEEAVEVA